MARSMRNLCGFCVGFFLMAGFMFSAYASTATGPHGAITFEGDTCQDLVLGVLRAQAAATPSTPLPYETMECDVTNLKKGSSVTMYWRDRTSSGSFPVVVGDLTAKEGEGSYLGFVLLALTYGVGLVAGLQR